MSTYYLPYISGAIMYPSTILRHFVSRGHDVTVVTFRHKMELPDTEIIDGVTVRRLPYELRIHKGFLSFTYPFRVFRDFRRADVIIFNQPVFEGIFVIGLARLLGKPVISLVNCHIDLGSGWKKQLMTACLNGAVSIQLKFSRKIVTYTSDYAENSPLLKRHMDRMTFIRPALDPCLTPHHERSSDPSHELQEFSSMKGTDIWVCYCGRISREKGLEHFVRSYPYLKRIVGSPFGNNDISKEIVFVFAGPYGSEVAGETDYFPFVRQECEQLGVPYLFLGSLDRTRLAALYQVIDCLVLPSVNRTEAFGIVQMEAMHFGKPVIASDLPGVRVLVRETGMGCLVRPGDPLDLAEKIGRVLMDPGFSSNEKRSCFETRCNPATSYETWDNLIA